MKLRGFIKPKSMRVGQREEVEFTLLNLDGSEYQGGAGGGVCQLYSAVSLVEQDSEEAEDLVLEIPVAEGDLIDVLVTIQAMPDGDPEAGSLELTTTENNDPGLLETGAGPLVTTNNVNLTESQWYTLSEDVMSDLGSATFVVREGGMLMLTFSLDINTVPVSVDVRNWRVYARRYRGGE